MTATILIIDDNEDDRHLCRSALESFGCNLELVPTAEAGLERIAVDRPDLILLDYNLPGMDGLCFMRRLAKCSGPAIPVIVLTGMDSAAVAVEVMRNGADDYLAKDIEGRYLTRLPGVIVRVMAACAQREQMRQLRQKTEALLYRNQLLMRNSMDGIYVMDQCGNIVDANDAFCRMLGYTHEEIARLNVADWDARWPPERLRERIEELAGTSAKFETVHRRKDGSLFDVEISASGMKNDGQCFIFAVSRDITERKKAEENILLESETEHRRAEVLAKQFSHLLQGSFNEIYLFDARSLHFLLTSEGAKKNLGYSEDELHRLTPLDLDPSFTRKKFGKMIAPLISGKQQSLLFETFHRRKDGTTYPVEMRLQLMETTPPAFMSIAQDITGRRHAENQLREFSAHLQNIREEEKASFAREIHDELGSTLAALKMDAGWLARKLSDKAEMLPLQTCVKSMSGLLDNAVIATRRIITDLRPAILDDIGLLAALKWQADQFRQRTGIECRCVCVCGEDDCRENYVGKFDKMLSINLFRICQEALTNVSRHSGASSVAIELHQCDEEVALSISDNGRGLPEGHTIAPTSYGMRGMRERAVQLGGKIEFDSPPGGGFSVTATLPLAGGNEKQKNA